MANEATINVGMSIRRTSTDGLRVLQDPNRSRGFRSNMNGVKGPVPGSVTVSTTGTIIDLSGLVVPGLCWLEHQGRADGVDVGADPSIYYVEYGVKDILTGRFAVWGELWPGDAWPMRLSRNLKEEYNSTGTGTGPANNSVFMISHLASCNIGVYAYER